MADIFQNVKRKQPQNRPTPVAGRPNGFWDKLLEESPAARKEEPKPEIKQGRMRKSDLDALVRYFKQRDGKAQDNVLRKEISNTCMH